MRIGARIKVLRLERGFSQAALAKRLLETTDRGQVSRWERGLAMPNVEHLEALARVFDVPEERVLCGCEWDSLPGRRRKSR